MHDQTPLTQNPAAACDNQRIQRFDEQLACSLTENSERLNHMNDRAAPSKHTTNLSIPCQLHQYPASAVVLLASFQ